MDQALLAVEVFVPDGMDDGAVSREVHRALEAAYENGDMSVRVSHVKTLMSGPLSLSRKAVSWSRKGKSDREARMITVTQSGKRKRVGAKMLMATGYVAAFPGTAKYQPAVYAGPNGSTQFGYAIVDRAIGAGLIEAELLPSRYSLTVTEAGLACLAEAGY